MNVNSHCSEPSGSPTRETGLPPSLLLAVIVTIACLASATPSQTPRATLIASTYETPETAPDAPLSIEHRVFDLLNHERVKAGLAPLTWTDQAATVARSHSANMADLRFFSHEDRQGRLPSNRANLLGLCDWRRIGENIALLKGYADPAGHVVEGWMQSPGHRENILDANFTETGIGLAIADDGTYYFTQLFILRRQVSQTISSPNVLPQRIQ